MTMGPARSIVHAEESVKDEFDRSVPFCPFLGFCALSFGPDILWRCLAPSESGRLASGIPRIHSKYSRTPARGDVDVVGQARCPRHSRHESGRAKFATGDVSVRALNSVMT